MSDDIVVVVVESEPQDINVVLDPTQMEDVLVEILYPEGSPGPPGPPGPPGVPGAGFNFVHDQGVPSTLWTIVHNLNGFPNVTCVESDGSEICGDITYVDVNTITFEIAWPVSGKAFLS